MWFWLYLLNATPGKYRLWVYALLLFLGVCLLCYKSRRVSRLANRFPFVFGFLGILSLCLIYQSNARFIGGSDVYPGRFVPVSLVTELNYDMNEFMFLRQNNPKAWATGAKYHRNKNHPSHGRVISNSPTLVPTLMAPFYIIPFRIWKLPPEHYLVFYMEKSFAALFCALSALFVYLAIREMKAPRSAALVISIAYALGTSTWALSSQALWQHGPSQCFLAASLWLWVRQKRAGTGYFLCGLLVGFAVGARLSNAFWAVLLFLDILILRNGSLRQFKIIKIFLKKLRRLKIKHCLMMVWTLIRHHKPLYYFILGGIPSAVFLWVYNTHHFGKPWLTAYSFIPGGVTSSLKYKFLPASTLGLLFSPSLGLIPNAPFYLFIPLSIWMAWRKPLPGNSRRYILIPLIFILANIYLYCLRHQWWGGWAYVYRKLADSLPMLSFLLFAVWRFGVPKVIRKEHVLAIWLVILFPLSLVYLYYDWGAWHYSIAFSTIALLITEFLALRRWNISTGKISKYLSPALRFILWSVFLVFMGWGIFIQAYGAYVWNGGFYRQWTNINQVLEVDIWNNAPGTIFNNKSVLWSLKWRESLLGYEWRYHRWDPERWITTPGKVYQDLLFDKTIKYGKYTPIILQIGKNYRPEKKNKNSLPSKGGNATQRRSRRK